MLCTVSSGHGSAPIGVGFARGGGATCLQFAGPELPSTLEQSEFILTHLRSRPPVFVMSFSCLASLWEQLRLGLARSPLLSPKNLNWLPAARPRWNTIELKYRLPRMDLPASTQKEHRPRTGKCSIVSN